MTHDEDEKRRLAAERPGDAEHTRRDMSYSPASGRETEELQKRPEDSRALDDPEIDASRVRVLPGTGGPDDPGDVGE